MTFLKRLFMLLRNINNPRLVLLKGLAFYVECEGALLVVNGAVINLDYSHERVPNIDPLKPPKLMMTVDGQIEDETTYLEIF
jgi:hypothetical protein